jgi:hypothetical protein
MNSTRWHNVPSSQQEAGSRAVRNRNNNYPAETTLYGFESKGIGEQERKNLAYEYRTYIYMPDQITRMPTGRWA